VEVSVKDGGPGIQAEAMAHLFEPFKTTKAEGLGIGLAISRVIVESHGGRIRAENDPAGGATFRFTLKAADGERNRLPDH
jgi:two-component system sensor kinase FixL